MKKIVSVIAFAALAAGMAMADVTIKMNYRTRPLMYGRTWQDIKQYKIGPMNDYKGDQVNMAGNKLQSNNISAKDGTTVKTDWFDLDGYAASQDNITMQVDSEKAGVQLVFMPTATTKANDGWRINTYNAYMKFGDLKVAAGVWKDGVADGNYRVKKDHDAAQTEGNDFELMKLGSGFNGVSSTFVDNVSSHFGKDNNLTGYAEYSLAVGDDISVKIYGAAVTVATADTTAWATGAGKNTYDQVTHYESKEDIIASAKAVQAMKGKDSNTLMRAALDGSYKKAAGIEGDTDTTSYHTGFVGRVQFNMKNLFNSEVIYKNPNQKTHTVAFYVMPTVMKALTLNVGAAFDFVQQGGFGVANANPGTSKIYNDTTYHMEEYKDNFTNWSVDLRARYAVNDKLSVTTMNKIWGTTYDEGFKIQKGLVGADNKAGVLAAQEIKMGLWDVIGVRYVINDTFACFINGAVETVLDGETKKMQNEVVKIPQVTPATSKVPAKVTFTEQKKTHDYEAGDKRELNAIEWRVTPGFQIYASKTACISIMAAISGGKGEVKGTNTYKYTINGMEVSQKKCEKSKEISALAVAIPIIFRVKL